MGLRESKLDRLLMNNVSTDVMSILKTHDRRRSHLEQVIDMLRVIYVMEGTALITRTASMTNMSYIKAKAILEKLEFNGLVITVVKRNYRKRFYEITSDGVEVLRTFLDVRDRLGLDIQGR